MQASALDLEPCPRLLSVDLRVARISGEAAEWNQGFDPFRLEVQLQDRPLSSGRRRFDQPCGEAAELGGVQLVEKIQGQRRGEYVQSRVAGCHAQQRQQDRDPAGELRAAHRKLLRERTGNAQQTIST